MNGASGPLLEVENLTVRSSTSSSGPLTVFIGLVFTGRPSVP